MTNREQLSDFKFKSLYPLLHRVINPSTSSFYLAGESGRYPTAWLDIDGNERAALHLRNSDLNKIHILFEQLARNDLPAGLRRAAAMALSDTLDHHRTEWSTTATRLDEELQALKLAIASRKIAVDQEPKWTLKQVAERRGAWRLREELDDWKEEFAAYTAYLSHLKRLLAFEPDPLNPFKGKIGDFLPEMSLGDSNTQAQLRHYVAGPSPSGLQIAADGHLDEERSFRYVDYPKLFSEQRAHNSPQPELPEKPIDFTAMRIRDTNAGEHAYWLYGGEDSQLEILTNPQGHIAVRPVQGSWRSGLPLALFEDPELHIPPGAQRQSWLSDWHSEQEWFAAIHKPATQTG